jgi:cytochrome c oxidase assembly factor CtaG
VLAIVPPNAIAGVVIATSSQVIYTYYNSVPHIWGFTALEDQMWGGAIMWIWSSEMMINIAVILLAVMFNQEKKRKAAMERMAALPNRRRMPAANEKAAANEAPLMAEQQAVTV